jgi:hypothetical protein
MIKYSALGAIGNTPLIRLNNVASQERFTCNIRMLTTLSTASTDFRSGETRVHFNRRFSKRQDRFSYGRTR